jgi:hypothetical protein
LAENWSEILDVVERNKPLLSRGKESRPTGEKKEVRENKESSSKRGCYGCGGDHLRRDCPEVHEARKVEEQPVQYDKRFKSSEKDPVNKRC